LRVIILWFVTAKGFTSLHRSSMSSTGCQVLGTLSIGWNEATLKTHRPRQRHFHRRAPWPSALFQWEGEIQETKAKWIHTVHIVDMMCMFYRIVLYIYIRIYSWIVHIIHITYLRI
jgi:hypothetical protein